jgi:hypothetical protein
LPGDLPARAAITSTATAATATVSTAAAAASTTTTTASAAESTATTASATTAEPASTTTSALGLRSSFIHGQCASIDLLAIQPCDRCIRFGVIAHFDERKTARLPTVAVAHDVDRIHLPKVGK